MDGGVEVEMQLCTEVLSRLASFISQNYYTDKLITDFVLRVIIELFQLCTVLFSLSVCAFHMSVCSYSSFVYVCVLKRTLRISWGRIVSWWKGWWSGVRLKTTQE